MSRVRIYATSKAWRYYCKPRKRGRWAWKPIDPRAVASYAKGAWDAIAIRKSILHMLMGNRK